MVFPDPLTYHGQIRTSIESMEIGDIIGCNYNKPHEFNIPEIGSFTDIGRTVNASDTEFNIRLDTPVYSGSMFLIKVAPGTLMTNQIVMADTKWINVVRAGVMYGKVCTFGGIEYLVHVPRSEQYVPLHMGFNGKLALTRPAILNLLRVEQVFSNTKINSGYYDLELAQDYTYDGKVGCHRNYPLTTMQANIYFNYSFDIAVGCYRFVLIYKENSKCVDFWH